MVKREIEFRGSRPNTKRSLSVYKLKSNDQMLYMRWMLQLNDEFQK